MAKKCLAVKVMGAVVLLLAVVILFVSDVPAQSEQDPRLNHNACVAACVLNQNIVHSAQGMSGDSRFHSWYNTYWRLTDCGESGWKTDLNFLFSIVSDTIGAPGGVTMQCWQGLAGQAYVCSGICNDYGLKDGAYAPNVRVSPVTISPGYVEVRVDNRLNTADPWQDPNAYSRHFYLNTTLQLNDGPELTIDDSWMPNLSFSNWITQQNYKGYDDCLNAFTDDNRCNLILPLAVTDTVDWSVNFFDGVFYDLSDYVSKQKGVDKFFDPDGYVLLESSGDSITIEQGPYAGLYYVKTHNRSNDTHTSEVFPWNASSGSVKITNNECLWCVGNRTETDIFVYGLYGPQENRLSGTYTVRTTAKVYHDKDFSNNQVSFSYTEDDLGDQFDLPPEDEDSTDDPEWNLAELPIIQLPGEGTFNYTLPQDQPGLMFRLDIPGDVYSGTISLTSLDGERFTAYGRFGGLPVLSYPRLLEQEFDCYLNASYASSDQYYFLHRGSQPFYLFMPRGSKGSSFQLKVEFVTNAGMTATNTHRQTKQAEYAQTQQALIRTFTEIESNDSRETANAWERVEPFTGELNIGDEDYISITFSEPGIYTFGITEVAPQMQVTLGLLFGDSVGFFGRESANNRGDLVYLTFDASAGETFFFKVFLNRYDPDGSYYTLEQLEFIPDAGEPNDEKDDAVEWNLVQGPITGYFWEVAHVNNTRSDFYRFTAPVTADGSAVTFQVTNPGADLRVRMSLLNQNGSTIHSPSYFEAGQDASLIYTLVPGQDYYIKLSTYNNRTSFQPYTLSAFYVGDGAGTGLSEIEPNNNKETANQWDMVLSFKGVLTTSSDKDYILIEIPTPGIYTFSITDVSPNLRVGLYLVRYGGSGVLHRVSSTVNGQGVALTMDGSAGEKYYLVVYASKWAADGALYQLSLTGFIPDPGEPNDQRSEATYWDVSEGPIQGYFWETTHVSNTWADYIRFTAPTTANDSLVTFTVANPGSDLSVCMGLLNHTGGTLLSSQCSPTGESATLSYSLTSGLDYYLKLSTSSNKTSLLPYSLSINFEPGEGDDIGESGRNVRFHGFVYRQQGLLPMPLANVPVYIHIPGQDAVLLDTTGWLGTYSAKVMVADGQQVTIWPELTDTRFVPDEDLVPIEESMRHHRSAFVLIGGQLVQDTPTPTPEISSTPAPPLIQTVLAETPTSIPTPTSSESTSTPVPTVTPTPEPVYTATMTATTAPTSTSTQTESPQESQDTLTTIIGVVWRLFANSDPAGIGAAEVILSINGVDQPAVFSQIDGLYLMEVEGIQPGDILRLRAQAPQDSFEPLNYQWQAELGVNRWEFDFYSYWEEITSPTTIDQNRIYGTVWDQLGGDVSGLYLNLQMGTSDAIQRIGPTDANGYFEAIVTIPNRMMVTVWVDAPGFVPSKLMFFHPYEPEDRELIFWRYRGENIQ